MNPLRSRPLNRLLGGPIIDPETGKLTRDAMRLFQDVLSRVDRTTTQAGEVQALAPVKGRTEGVGVTVQNLTPTGQLNNFTNVAAGRNTDNLADGIGSPLTGGKRGFVALNSANRLAGTFRNNPANVSGTPTSSTGLSNDGITTSIIVPAQTVQFGDGLVSYNSGSVDPGSFGTFYVFIDDANFSGGAMTFQFSSTPPNQTASSSRILVGKITTLGGAAKTGGGFTGGTTLGGAGGRGYIE